MGFVIGYPSRAGFDCEAILHDRLVAPNQIARLIQSDSFLGILPLRQRSDLLAAAVRKTLLEHTEGVTVRIVRLIEILAIDAIRSGQERINQESLAALSSLAPLLSMEEHSHGSLLPERSHLALPVTLRPYSGELLYSWLSRIAALYRVGMIDLLGPSVPVSFSTNR